MATGQAVVGVSICWDYLKSENLVNAAVDAFVESYIEPGIPEDSKLQYNPLREKVLQAEQYCFLPAPAAPADREQITKMLSEMRSKDQAFIVFETQEGRLAALKTSREQGGLCIDGCRVFLQEAGTEPENIDWRNFSHSLTTKTLRSVFGICEVVLALVFWVAFFYAPYAWAMFTWNYDNGQQPPEIYAAAFSMVVCCGNGIMYQVCFHVAESIGFRRRDHKETFYMILYTAACTLNVAMDLVTTYYTSVFVMEGLDFRTYRGTKLENLPTFTELFETYAIQRSLAESLEQYAFPSTFLLPFLMEPVTSIWWPLYFFKQIIRAHPKMHGKIAENHLAVVAMDLGRYADILLNVLLGILMFYFPGGYTHKLFFAMFACHVFIYFLDQYRVLRAVPTFNCTTMDVDWWAQAMLAPLCALIFSCLVFKANCHGYSFCLTGTSVFWTCFAAFVSHTIVHLILLLFFVPMFSRSPQQKDSPSELTYEKLNQQVPCSWFSANPVHCLRSKYIYSHSTPCVPYLHGKEHTLQTNREIGCYFQTEKAKVKGELTDVPADLAIATSRSLRSLTSRFLG